MLVLTRLNGCPFSVIDILENIQRTENLKIANGNQNESRFDWQYEDWVDSMDI